MKNKTPAAVLLVLAALVAAAIFAAEQDGSKLGVGTEVSYWMNFAEPGGLPGLKPFDATIHAIHSDGSVDLIVSLGKGNQVKVDKAERASRAMAGCWTLKNSSKDGSGTTNSPRSDP